MKKMLLGAAAAVAMIALPTAAHADGGYIDVVGGNDDLTLTGLGSADSDFWGVDGVFSGSNVQLGGHYSTFDETDNNVWTVDGHLFTRNDKWQLGAGIGYTDADSTSEWAVAGEGLLFLDRTTLGATLTYSNADDTDTTFWGVDGEARFFLTDNFRVGVNAGWGSIDGGGDSADVTTLGVGAEWQFDNTPFSVFAGYNHTDADIITSDAWGVGARWNFGSSSLIDRDRHGANLRTPVGGFSRLFGF